MIRTDNLKLYKWEAKDTKLATFEEFNKNAEIIDTRITESQKKLTGVVNLKEFDVVGDGTADDTAAIQSAIDYCYANNQELTVPYGIYRTKNLVLKVNIRGTGVFLFDNGTGFTNFEADGSKRYDITSLQLGRVESNKSSFWNSTDAGESFDVAVEKKDVIRKYGQRVFIGNKTTTPNNILSNNSQEKLDGTGFWNKDYSQWNSSNGLDLNDIRNSYNSLSNKEDTNILSLPRGARIECEFVGFGVGLTLKGSYDIDLRKSSFKRCKVGVVTDHGGTLPGLLGNANSKCTTITIAKCLFEDISFASIYANSLLQSKIKDNIFQPSKLGVVLITAAENDIYENYNEIVFSGVMIHTNDAKRNNIRRNFANTSYVTWQVYLRYGVNNVVNELLAGNKVYVHAAVTNSDFDNTCDVTMDTSFFYVNGNSIDRRKSKVAVFTTTGTSGTGMTSVVKSSTRKDGSAPKFTFSQAGIFFNGIEEILSVELLSDNNKIGRLSYYDIDNAGNPKTMYLDIWDNTNKTFVRKDIRENGVKYTFRVAFNDGLM